MFVVFQLAVLEVFYTMCKDATILVELFLNFDCNDTFGSSSDLFESIVRTLGAIVQRQGKPISIHKGGQ